MTSQTFIHHILFEVFFPVVNNAGDLKISVYVNQALRTKGEKDWWHLHSIESLFGTEKIFKIQTVKCKLKYNKFYITESKKKLSICLPYKLNNLFIRSNERHVVCFILCATLFRQIDNVVSPTLLKRYLINNHGNVFSFIEMIFDI